MDPTVYLNGKDARRTQIRIQGKLKFWLYEIRSWWLFPAFLLHEAAHLFFIYLFGCRKKHNQCWEFSFFKGYVGSNVKTRKTEFVSSSYTTWGLTIRTQTKCPLRQAIISIAPLLLSFAIPIGFIITVLIDTSFIPYSAPFLIYFQSAMHTFMPSNQDMASFWYSMSKLKRIKSHCRNWREFIWQFRKHQFDNPFVCDVDGKQIKIDFED